MKKCTKCLVEKSLDSFAKRSASKDGLMFTCRECNKKYHKDNAETIKAKRQEYYVSNRESILEDKVKYYNENSEQIRNKRKTYYYANVDKCRDQCKKYHGLNRDRMRELGKNYYYENRDEIRRKFSEYQKNNPHIFNNLSAKRRAYKLQATVKWANENIIKNLYIAAKDLSTKTGQSYHVDHIVPLKSKYVCGLHVEHNLQIIPASENCSKRNKYWPDMW